MCRGSIHDFEVFDVLVPGWSVGGRIDGAVVDAIEILRDLEQSVTHAVEREVGLDGVRVDVVVPVADAFHPVAEVPRPDPGLSLAGRLPLGLSEQGEIVPGLLGEQGTQLRVEVLDRGGILRHTDLVFEVTGVIEAEDLGLPSPQFEQLLQDSHVRLGTTSAGEPHLLACLFIR